MESYSKMSAGAVSVLPDDPVVEILSRVPAKSVCRFKCVSKGWRDLIDDPDNRKRLRQAMQGLFVQKKASKYEWDNSFSFIDLTVRSVPLDIDPGFSFLPQMFGITTFLLDSCNGLILFEYHRQESAGYYIVCDPTTKQWSAVPACSSDKPLTHPYLAFDPDVSSHFHLVQFHVFKDVESLYVYSSETRTWSQKQFDEQKEKGQLEGSHHQCAFVNGFLHLIVWSLVKQHMLVVDVQGKARRIAVPGMADGRPGKSYVRYLGQSQGHLHCVTLEYPNIMHDYDKLSIWFLQNYDTQEWVLKNTVNISVVFGTGGRPEFEVVSIHQDCNVIFFLQQSFSNSKLIAYHMDSKEVSVIAIYQDYKVVSDFARYIPYFSESPALKGRVILVEDNLG